MILKNFTIKIVSITTITAEHSLLIDGKNEMYISSRLQIEGLGEQRRTRKIETNPTILFA